MTSSLKSEVPISTEFASVLTAIAPKDQPGIDHTNLLKSLIGDGGTNTEKTSFPNGPLSCDYSGTLTYTGAIQSTQQFTIGDSISLTFSECSNEQGVVINGSLNYVVSEFTGEMSVEGSYYLAYLMTFDIQYQDSNSSVSINGQIATEIAEDDTQHATSLRAPSLTVTVDGNERAIRGYVYTQTLDKTAHQVSFSAAGGITSDELGGTIEFETIAPLVISPASPNPQAGEFVLRDTQGATATLLVKRGGSVEISIDSDGDGEADDVQLEIWSNVENYFE